MSAEQGGRSPENDAAREDLCRHGVPMFYPCAWCVIPPAKGNPGGVA